MVEVTVKYEGDLHCVSTHGPSGAEIATDAPVDNHGRGEAFSPTDLVAAALGSCMATIMGILAQRKNLPLEGTKITVKKEMTAAPRRIAKLETDIYLPLPADHPEREMVENAALTCPVHRSLLEEIEKPVRFHYIA
jgi:putative redox protein